MYFAAIRLAMRSFLDAERDFPTSNTLYMVLEAENFAAPEVIEATIDFLLDAQLLEGVDAVLSPFAVPISVEGETVQTDHRNAVVHGRDGLTV